MEPRPFKVEVPDSTILPEAKGVDAVGATWMFCQVSVFVLELIFVTVNVICVEVMEVTAPVLPFAILLMLWVFVPLPATLMVTAAAVLNTKPVGALRTMVPKPMSPALPSVTTGPVKVVQVPAAAHPVAVSEGTAPPPVALVTVTLALATPLMPSRRSARAARAGMRAANLRALPAIPNQLKLQFAEDMDYPFGFAGVDWGVSPLRSSPTHFCKLHSG